MGKAILGLLLVILIFTNGCININLGKTAEEERTSTSSEKQTGVPVKTQIKAVGQGMEMIISPSQNNDVKDIVTITVTTVPTNAGVIGFAIEGPGVADIHQTGPNLGYDADGSDGWSLEFDTNGYPNNKYAIAAIAFPADRQSGEPPLGAVQAQVEIKNSELSPVPSPAVTAPYKIISGSCKNPLQSIEDAKKLNADTISLGVFAGYTDNNGAAIWEPPEKAAKGCAKLIALAHENSIKTAFSVNLANEEDMVIEDFHFNREKFMQTHKEMLKSYAAFAQQNKVSIFIIATEIDTLAGIDDVGKPAGTPILQPNEKGSLAYDSSKEFIKGVREVYSGKIAIGFVGLDYDEPEAPYYPFEGADIVCFSGSESREGQVEESIQHMRMKAALVKKTGQKVGIDEVMLCEVYFLPKGVELLFTSTSTSAGLKELMDKQSSFYKASFQQDEKEFFRRLISEAGPELSGVIIPWGYSGPITVRGRLAEQTIAEEFGKWK